MSETVISAADVVVRRGEFHLGPVDLTLGRGLTILLGVNGAGKSTLITTLVGLRRPESGAVSMSGLDPYSRRNRKEFMRAVGLVPQDSPLLAAARIEDVLDYAAWLKGVRRHVAATRIPALLEKLRIEGLRGRKVGALSGGERRRVSIGAALVHEPRLLVLDEPTVGLDPIQRVSLREVLIDLATERTLLLSTHLVEDVTGADRVVALGGGATGLRRGGGGPQGPGHAGRRRRVRP